MIQEFPSAENRRQYTGYHPRQKADAPHWHQLWRLDIPTFGDNKAVNFISTLPRLDSPSAITQSSSSEPPPPLFFLKLKRASKPCGPSEIFAFVFDLLKAGVLLLITPLGLQCRLCHAPHLTSTDRVRLDFCNLVRCAAVATAQFNTQVYDHVSFFHHFNDISL